MDKLKILHVSNYYPPHIGGIETVCYDFCGAVKKLGEVHVVCFNDQPDTVIEEIDGIKVTRVGIQAKIASQALAKGYGEVLHKELKEFNPDIVHFHYPNPYASHYLLKAFKRIGFKGKFVLHWHADIIKQKLLRLFFVSQNKKLLERADLVLATSPAYLEGTDYLPRYKEKVKVLPLCVGSARDPISESVKKAAAVIREEYAGKKIGFFFGRHVKYKGLEYLIEADRYLPSEEYVLLVAGSGPLTEKLKKKAMLFSNIRFLGRLSDGEVNAYLSACDFFAFPSITRNEAFGISLAEALYFGKPAVTFTVPGSGINWVSVNCETGYEAPNRDAKAYASLIIKMFSGSDYEVFSKNAKERAERYFTRDCFESNALSIYKSLMQE